MVLYLLLTYRNSLLTKEELIYQANSEGFPDGIEPEIVEEESSIMIHLELLLELQMMIVTH